MIKEIKCFNSFCKSWRYTEICTKIGGICMRDEVVVRPVYGPSNIGLMALCMCFRKKHHTEGISPIESMVLTLKDIAESTQLVERR